MRTGDLHVTDCSGQTHVFGDASPPRIAIKLETQAAERAIALRPSLAIGEAYMNGTLVVTTGSIYDFVALAIRNLTSTHPPLAMRAMATARKTARGLKQLNSRRRARHNVAHHYDIDERIYRLFLDDDLQYSCAYFQDAGNSLETAQRAKKRHLAAKLDITPSCHVLDIGSGWGGLALYLATNTGARVTGITLSENQIATARRRAEAMGLSKVVTFEPIDYRDTTGTFDRIVSVGMLEHVGIHHIPAYFKLIADRLADDGVAVIHAIGRADGPGYTNPFIEKYIFPGGYFPALSEVLPAIEQSHLIVTDIEILRLHYAETLRAWRLRFANHRDQILTQKDERFYRMWEFYLAASEAAFRHDNLFVFQIQLTKSLTTLPITRDYITAQEQLLEQREEQSASPYRDAGE